MLLAVFALLSLPIGARSEMVMTVTPEIVDPEFTPFVTLRCSLEEQEEGNLVSISLYKSELVRYPRTATRELVAMIHINKPRSPTSGPGHEKMAVQGHISQYETELGSFLEVVWSDPGVEDLGRYICEANVLGQMGEIILFAEGRVTTSEPMMDRLLVAMSKLKEELDAYNQTLTDIQRQVDRNAPEVENRTNKTGCQEEVGNQTNKTGCQEVVENSTNVIGCLQDAPDFLINCFKAENSTYLLYRSSEDTGTNHTRAQAVCKTKGYFLAEVKSADEFEAIQNETVPYLQEGNSILAAGERKAGQTDWIFPSSLEVMTFFVWGPGEPPVVDYDMCLGLRKSLGNLDMVPWTCGSLVVHTYFLCQRTE